MFGKFFNSKFFELLSKFVDVLIIGLYFLLCSIPIFTIGASLTSLYYAINKSIYQGRGYTTEFFHSFKQNFKQSTLTWLIYIVLFGFCGLDIYLTRQMAAEGKYQTLGIVFLVLFVALVMLAIYHFAYIARFSNKVLASFKISFVLLILHFPTTLIMLVILVGFAVVCYIIPPVVLVAPALYAVCIRPLLEKVFRKYMTEEDLEHESSYN